ncbi:hypothetical protein OJAV_G00083460 [Oryzias javanicus]|uniref:Uncharacterized protein n=1 Tax=Oryzias javanicus TaxID=123683 RepID=A0A437D5P5_ORYJA|nr:hypothetical protein OJAV_G00083460 [Oryzias javanicus]
MELWISSTDERLNVRVMIDEQQLLSNHHLESAGGSVLMSCSSECLLVVGVQSRTRFLLQFWILTKRGRCNDF